MVSIFVNPTAAYTDDGGVTVVIGKLGKIVIEFEPDHTVGKLVHVLPTVA